MDTQIKSLEEVKSLTQNLPWQKENGVKEEKDKCILELNNIFLTKLAPYFLYGGYIRVLDKYRIYIKCVEFYFHSEKDDGIKDDIVYHRNDYHVEGMLPYFLPFTLHAHASGFDIAFENPEKEYRASALIRAYEIYDEKDEKKYMNYGKKDQKNQKPVSMFIHSFEPQINTQSTYLYDILNGFGDAGAISWVHDLSKLFLCHETLLQNKRKGVYDKSREQWNKPEYNEPRSRQWSFSRKESIKDII